MKVKWIKTLTTLFNKSKDTVIKHAPQIMAAAGAGCFIAATYCAIKETPEAMAKLEEKMKLDPEMTPLQKAAVVVPVYRKTLIFTGAGGALTLAAWKVEATRMAELAGIAAAALKDNDKLVAAAKEVVGEEKAQEIVEKKEELLTKDYQVDSNSSIPSDQIPYLFKFPGGVKIWTTWAKFKSSMDYNIRVLATNQRLSLYETYIELGADADDLTDEMNDTGWQIKPGEASDYLETDEIMDWAYEKLEYSSKPYDHGKGDSHVAAWEIVWTVKPEKFDYDVTG